MIQVQIQSMAWAVKPDSLGFAATLGETLSLFSFLSCKARKIEAPDFRVGVSIVEIMLVMC